MNCKPGELAFIVKVSKNIGEMQPLIDELVGLVVKCIAITHSDVWRVEPKNFRGQTDRWRATAVLLAISDEYLRPIRGEPEADECDTSIELAPKRQMEFT